MENITFDVIVKKYLEIGASGLAIVIFFLLVILLIQKIKKEGDAKNKAINEKDTKIDELYNKVIDVQKELFNSMSEKIIREITQHTPSPEENKKLTEVQQQVDSVLEDILIKTNASRVCLVQYHNGGRGINKQSFLKMSITNEKMLVGEQAIMPKFKDQFRSALSYVVNKLDTSSKCYIENIEDIKEPDYGTYEFLRSSNIKQIYFNAIKGQEDMIVGYVAISFNKKNKNDGNKEEISRIMNRKIEVLETLLTLDTIE